MKRRKVVFMVISFVCAITCSGQTQKRPEGYNYLRGVEAVQNENYQEALDFLNKDITENPKNGYSYSWVAMIRMENEEYGKALTAADLALKYLPKKDVEYLVFAYTVRAQVYLNLEDTVKTINDLTAAIGLLPEDESLYEKRAQVYYEQKRYDLADMDYHKMIALQPGEPTGYLGIGRNASDQKRWDDAIKQFDYAIKLDGELSKAYSFRAEAYIGKEDWNKATDDIVKALLVEYDPKAVYLAVKLTEPASQLLLSKMKIESAKWPNESKWPYVMGLMNEHNKKYDKAVSAYQEANRRNASPSIYTRIAECRSKEGKYADALRNVNMALNMDSTDNGSLARKANILYELGDVDSAIHVWDKVLSAIPEYGFGYYRRGWFKELSGDFDGAIEDLTTCVVLDPEESYAYQTRGDIYLKQGKRELAEADFKKVIEIEDKPEKYDCIHYAYQGLGQYEKAIAAMDSIIARDEEKAGNYYDAACLYARMGDKHRALEYLEKSLELGYRRFSHMERDADMDLLRDTEEYKALIRKYRQAEAGDEKHVVVGAFQAIESQDITEIPFTKDGDVYKVKCSINGLALHFVFDTGASDVSISMVEATFMLKNGYLTDSDIIGNQRYMDANGDISVGTVVNLKHVDLGGLELSNIRATVVRNQKAPLLLGQSVLGRLGKIEMDNFRQVLRISKAQ